MKTAALLVVLSSLLSGCVTVATVTEADGSSVKLAGLLGKGEIATAGGSRLAFDNEKVSEQMRQTAGSIAAWHFAAGMVADGLQYLTGRTAGAAANEGAKIAADGAANLKALDVQAAADAAAAAAVVP